MQTTALDIVLPQHTKITQTIHVKV